MLPPHRPVAATRLARAHTAHNIPQIYEEIPRNETKGPDLPRNRRAVAPRRGDFPAFFWNLPKTFYFCLRMKGGLAQLARALAWHARGHEFESRILHQETTQKIANPCKSRIYRDFYFGQNAEKGIEKRVTCGLFGVLFPGPKKYTELLVTDWFAPVCSGLPLDMRHLGN